MYRVHVSICAFLSESTRKHYTRFRKDIIIYVTSYIWFAATCKLSVCLKIDLNLLKFDANITVHITLIFMSKKY